MPTVRTTFSPSPLFSHSLPPSPPPHPALSPHFFRLFKTPHTKHILSDLFHHFPVPKLSTLLRKSGPPFGPPSLPPLPPAPLPLPPAFSLHVFFFISFDPSHTECMLFGPLSIPPLFSHSLPVSPTGVLATCSLTSFDPSCTECLLFEPFSSKLTEPNRAKPSRAGAEPGRAEPSRDEPSQLRW